VDLTNLGVYGVLIGLALYADLNLFHSLMKRQFVEVSDNFIRIKKLTSDKKLNWSDVKSVDELYNKKLDIVAGVRLKNKKTKGFLKNKDIVINFHLYKNIDIDDFIKLLLRKKRI
jgi:hypothetical protein